MAVGIVSKPQFFSRDRKVAISLASAARLNALEYPYGFGPRFLPVSRALSIASAVATGSMPGCPAGMPSIRRNQR